MPINSANESGPARSPTVLEIPKPSFAKVDTHCEIACSLAPEQTIIMNRIINTFDVNSSFMLIPFSPESIKFAIGTFAKTMPLIIGNIAQIMATIRQFSMPKILKNTVLNSTTAICPQQ